MESPMALSPEALTLIRQWEGCRLSAYPDPASGGEPWTIGYGHTGPEVTAGLTISREQAERWLADDLAAAEAAVIRLLQPPAGLTPTPAGGAHQLLLQRRRRGAGREHPAAAAQRRRAGGAGVPRRSCPAG